MLAAVRRGVRAGVGDVAEWLGRRVTSLPGVAGVVCGVAGARLLWGNGWALLAAAGFLLAIDRRMP